jgi:ABC-type Fe3+-hydroxamate transport system substrate-binding protein
VRLLRDDQGTAVVLPDSVGRVVSLVPSLTEAIAVTAPGILVGATDWCTHPADLDLPRVRGTKNPDLAQIIALRPDVVICNKEENRKVDVDRLRAAGVAVWVTVIENLDDAFRSLHRLTNDVLDRGRPDWLTSAEQSWSLPPIQPRVHVVVPVWRNPWIVIGSPTFAGSLLHRLGADNVFEASPKRYPRVDPDQLEQASRLFADVVLLPDEPYAFSAEDGPEAFPGAPVRLIDGRSLTWYGPSLATARARLLGALTVS